MSRAASAALVLIGGMTGTAARAGLESAFPTPAEGWPWTTFWINISGSLVLGVLLEMLAAGEDEGWRRHLRLGVGTGLLGGYTTYSTFSVETITLLQGGQWFSGIGYALASVGIGIAAAVVAISVVRRWRGTRAMR